MRDERLSVLKDNEEYCNKEEDKRKKGITSDDEEEGDGFVDDEDDDDEDDDNGGTYENEDTILGRIAKVRANVKNGGGGGKLDDDYGDEDDDENDSDYEFTGGDLAIYDSALDDVDELLFVKDQLERLNAQDPAYT